MTETALEKARRELCLLAFGHDCGGKVSMAFHTVRDRLEAAARLAGIELAACRLEEHAKRIGEMPKANPPDDLDAHRRYGSMMGNEWAHAIRAEAGREGK